MVAVKFAIFLFFITCLVQPLQEGEEIELKETDFLHEFDKAVELSIAQKKPILLLSTIGKIDSVVATKTIEGIGSIVLALTVWNNVVSQYYLLFQRISEDPDLVNELKNKFILFRTDSANILGRFDIKNIPSFVITDPFLNKLCKPFTASKFSIEKNYKRVLDAFIDDSPNWGNDIDKAIENNHAKKDSGLVIYAFLRRGGRNSKRTMEVLSDKILVNLRKKALFVKEDFDKCPFEIKSKWKANNEGAFVVLRSADNDSKYKIVKFYERSPNSYELGKFLFEVIEMISAEKER
ncbi:MAG: hypothetical protein HY606_09265 [Planctomycetes bacterium]|nr:hypothetical protein [Planctomycetota bacterium]